MCIYWDICDACPSNKRCSPECMKVTQNQQTSSIAQKAWGDRNANGWALSNFESMFSCPLCRAQLPNMPDQTFTYSLKNANKGMEFAMHAVSKKYKVGKGTKKNPKEAAKWFKLARTSMVSIILWVATWEWRGRRAQGCSTGKEVVQTYASKISIPRRSVWARKWSEKGWEGSSAIV